MENNTVKAVDAEGFITLLQKSGIYDKWFNGFKKIHKEGKEPHNEVEVIDSLNKLEKIAKEGMWTIPFVMKGVDLQFEDTKNFVALMLEEKKLPRKFAYTHNYVMNNLTEDVREAIIKYITEDQNRMIREHFDNMNEPTLKFITEVMNGNIAEKMLYLNILEGNTDKIFLSNAFTWKDTTEGGQYWADIHGKIRDDYVSNLPEETAKIFMKRTLREALFGMLSRGIHSGDKD